MKMNDRYLFRGKRADNGEWVKGELSKWNDGDVFIVEQSLPFYKEQYPIVPETVGQCTDLIDKNGTLIFEGDILMFTNDDGEKTPYEVRWSEIYAGYVTVEKDGATVTMDFWDKRKKDYEIIGNIHDNSDLAEELKEVIR